MRLLIGGIPEDILEHEYRHEHGLLGPGECPEKMRKFLSRMRVVGGSLAMNLKENFSTQGINELVEKWNALVSEIVTLEMTTAQVQTTDAVAEKSLHCGCPADGRHLVSCPTALGEMASRPVEDGASLEEKARQFRLTHGPFNLEGVSGHASRWEDRYAAAFASEMTQELRKERIELLTQRNLAREARENWRQRAEVAEKERDDLARESKLQSAECEALQIQLQQARQELVKTNTRVRSERRKHIEAELHKP